MGKAKPKILLVNDYITGGGAEQVFLNHKKILRDDYDIATFVGNDKNVMPGIFQHFFSVRFFFKFLKTLKNEKPDIIHLHNYHNYISPSILASIGLYKRSSKKNPKVVYTAHDFHLVWPDALFGYYEQGKFKRMQLPVTTQKLLWFSLSDRGKLISLYKKTRWIFNYKVLRLHRHIDLIVAPGSFLMEKFKAILPAKSITVVRNPCPTLPASTTDEFRINEYKPGKILEIVFLGRLSIEKGLSEFIELLFKEKIGSYRLSIYGDGPLRESIQQKINGYGLVENIQLKGRIAHDEIQKVLQQSDVLLLPSICYENAPLVLVEGAMRNVKLLTCDYGGMKETGEICGNCYYFNYEDPYKLTSAFKEIERDLADGKGYSDREKLSQMFSFSIYRKNVEDLYNSLAYQA